MLVIIITNGNRNQKNKNGKYNSFKIYSLSAEREISFYEEYNNNRK